MKTPKMTPEEATAATGRLHMWNIIEYDTIWGEPGPRKEGPRQFFTTRESAERAAEELRERRGIKPGDYARVEVFVADVDDLYWW